MPFVGKILNLFENAPFITYSISLNSNYGQGVLEIKQFVLNYSYWGGGGDTGGFGHIYIFVLF